MPEPGPVAEQELLAGYPPVRPIPPEDIRPTADEVLVVLDDDPTGTQPVARVPVLTRWREEDLAWALDDRAERPHAVYVLTNSRSLPAAQAMARTREVDAAASAAATRSGVRPVFVSRSDSTLRGHFPAETDALVAGLAEQGAAVDGVLMVPAFPDAGRVTIGGVHYLRQPAADPQTGPLLVPVNDTEFARDATFGYGTADLPGYVQEKTAGRIRAEQVLRVDLRVLRSGTEAVREVLAAVTGGTVVVADAVAEDDLRALALGLAAAEAHGRRFVYRVGPSFVRARIGQAQPQPLTTAALRAARAMGTTGVPPAAGGLVVVGSHVDLTTRQLAHLQATRPDLPAIEIEAPAVLSEDSRAEHLQAVVQRVLTGLAAGDVLVHTSRTLVRGRDAEDSLAQARSVSAAVVQVVRAVIEQVRPAFVVAKGGITSSDVATAGLGIHRAEVLGPMLPGLVSAWAAVEGPAAGLPYVVFAGNVGAQDSLTEVVRRLDEATD